MVLRKALQRLLGTPAVPAVPVPVPDLAPGHAPPVPDVAPPAGIEAQFHFEATKDSGPLGRTTEAAASKFDSLQYRSEDFYDHFPCFTSAKNLSRFVSFYECYKRTLGIAGHIAEVGVYRGAVSFFFTKLALMYEPHGLTQVHGFDWFKEPEGENAPKFPDPASYHEPYERICSIVNVQGLQSHLLLPRVNVLTELQDFFQRNDYLRFKIVFLDAGTYDIVARCIEEFWPRLSQGGILILDQYNFEVAPGETLAVRDLLPEDAVIHTFPQGWMPTAYVVKGEKLAAAEPGMHAGTHAGG